MKKFLLTLAFALAACTPPATDGPEGVIMDLYATVQQNIGQRSTPIDAIPMTDDLRSLVDQAEAAADARNEPFIGGDLAADCQDCTSLTDLVVGAQTHAEAVPPAPDHRMVEARFTLNGNEPRQVIYDMVETPQGWRVDNILSEGFNLRTEAQAYLQNAPEEAAAPVEPAAP